MTGVFGADAGEVKSVSVMEGHSVTLHMNDTKIQSDTLIMWTFGPRETLIARIHRKANEISIYDDVHDGMFRDRLKLSKLSGSLTITNIMTELSGLYKLTIISTAETSYTFSLNVHAHLPVPFISRVSSQCSSSSTCVVLCSVMNVSHVSVSWYKGKSLLSSISVSDLNIRLSLPLEVEHQDTNTYRCVVNNTVTNHTQHLNITQVCHKCSVRGLHPGYIALMCVVVLGITAAVVKCMLCSKELVYNNNTSSMLRHYRALHENKERNGGGPIQATRKQELDEALVTMIVKDTQPFSVVEDVGFRDYVHKLDPTYVLPTRQAVKAMVEAKYA
ncbi:uncharacterized protein LOC130548534 [Triplophysa rosa]|uniref:uncharacterized protein LOC130548534 n=1 Tax=Triplophysa rosa TaxID=992332 RepID=UPI002546354E|nr:uncharacterized protein LOC130548534 [Triplophysa rosa]